MRAIVKFDKTRAVEKLAALKRGVTEDAMPATLKSGGRVAAISMATSTTPFGNGAAAKVQGENATARDIRKVYATPGDAFGWLKQHNEQAAQGFWKAFNSGAFGRAQKILEANRLGGIPLAKFDGGTAHRAARNEKTGRVNLPRPLMVVTNPAALARYIAQKKKEVGFAKSGWAECGRILGSIRGLRATLADGARDITANWITRHRAPASMAFDKSNPAKPFLILTSLVRYAAQALQPNSKTKALQIARERMAKALAIAAKAEAKKAFP